VRRSTALSPLQTRLELPARSQTPPVPSDRTIRRDGAERLLGIFTLQTTRVRTRDSGFPAPARQTRHRFEENLSRSTFLRSTSLRGYYLRAAITCVQGKILRRSRLRPAIASRRKAAPRTEPGRAREARPTGRSPVQPARRDKNVTVQHERGSSCPDLHKGSSVIHREATLGLVVRVRSTRRSRPSRIARSCRP
jgi:hypothetical protein